jgi:hypothetical protein
MMVRGENSMRKVENKSRKTNESRKEVGEALKLKYLSCQNDNPSTTQVEVHV